MKNAAPFRIIERKDILVFIAAVVLFAGLVVWMVSGTVEITAVGNGVAVDGHELGQIHSLVSGCITDLFIQESSYIEQGDLVANILPDGENETVPLYSQFEGYVYHVTPAQWQHVDVGDCIAYISDSDEYMPDMICAVLPVDAMSSLVLGETRVRIAGNFFSVDTYGYMTGTVIGCSTMQETENDLLDFVELQTNVDYLLGDSSEIYVAIIELDTDEYGYPIFTRDAANGQGLELELHQECVVTYILKNSHPYEIIFNSRGARK